MSPLGKALFEMCAGRRHLFQSGKGIPKHGLEIEGAGRPIDCREGFYKVGIEFKQLTDEPLRNLGRGQIHAIQSSKQG